jgi:hypothetical protein
MQRVAPGVEDGRGSGSWRPADMSAIDQPSGDGRALCAPGNRFTLDDVPIVLVAATIYVIGGALLFGGIVWAPEALIH